MITYNLRIAWKDTIDASPDFDILPYVKEEYLAEFLIAIEDAENCDIEISWDAKAEVWITEEGGKRRIKGAGGWPF